jgi:hypothetical protein
VVTGSSKQNVLEEKIRTYFGAKREVIAVYLFGSFARGKERDRSDVDLGIVLDAQDRDLFSEKRNEYLVELGRILRKDIDPVILNVAGQELWKQVFAKGKCILVRDQRKLARHKMVMMARIAEFGPYRNRMQSGLIRKVMAVDPLVDRDLDLILAKASSLKRH